MTQGKVLAIGAKSRHPSLPFFSESNFINTWWRRWQWRQWRRWRRRRRRRRNGLDLISETVKFDDLPPVSSKLGHELNFEWANFAGIENLATWHWLSFKDRPVPGLWKYFFPSSSTSAFLLVDFHTHHFCKYDRFLIGAQRVSGTQGEHLC